MMSQSPVISAQLRPSTPELFFAYLWRLVPHLDFGLLTTVVLLTKVVDEGGWTSDL